MTRQQARVKKRKWGAFCFGSVICFALGVLGWNYLHRSEPMDLSAKTGPGLEEAGVPADPRIGKPLFALEKGHQAPAAQGSGVDRIAGPGPQTPQQELKPQPSGVSLPTQPSELTAATGPRNIAQQHWRTLKQLPAKDEAILDRRGEKRRYRLVNDVENKNYPWLISSEPSAETSVNTPVDDSWHEHRVVLADQFVVTLKPGVDIQQFKTEAAHLGMKSAQDVVGGGVLVLRFPLTKLSHHFDILDRLAAHNAIEHVDEDQVYYASQLSDDPYINAQWALKNNGQDPFGLKETYLAQEDVAIEPSWKYLDSCAVTVAVIDTGADIDHPDLKANLLTAEGRSFVGTNPTAFDDDNGHGTHVSGIIGAVGGNKTGISGICKKARIIPIKALDAKGEGTLSSIVNAIRYAATTSAKIVNMSLGAPGSDPTMSAALTDFLKSDRIIVVAAGNDGTDNDTKPVFPASFSHERLLAVAALDPAGNLASFSNFGANSVGIAAPGHRILSTWPINLPGTNTGVAGYQVESGTSMASPYAAGCVALMWSFAPSWTGQQVIDAIKGSVSVGALNNKVNGNRKLRMGTLLSMWSQSPTWKTLKPDKKVNIGEKLNVSGAVSLGPAIMGMKNMAGLYAGSTKIADVDASNLANLNFSVPVGDSLSGTVPLELEMVDMGGRIYRVPLWSITINKAPIAALTVESPALLYRGTQVNLTVNASDTDGTIAKVQFLVDDKPILELNAPPFKALWTVDRSGEQKFSVKVWDSDGGVAQSKEESLEVKSLAWSSSRVVQSKDYYGDVVCSLRIVDATGVTQETVTTLHLKERVYCQKFCAAAGPATSVRDQYVVCGDASGDFFRTPR